MKLNDLIEMLNGQLNQRLGGDFPALTRKLDGLAITTVADSQALQRLILQGTQENIAPNDSTDIHLFHLLQNIRFAQPTNDRGRTPRQTEVATLYCALYTTSAAVVDKVGVFLSTRPNVALASLELNPANSAKLLRLDRVPQATSAGESRYFVVYTYTYRSELGGLCE